MMGAEETPFEPQGTELACPLCCGRKVNKPLGPLYEERLGPPGRQSHKQMTAERAAKIEACPTGLESQSGE